MPELLDKCCEESVAGIRNELIESQFKEPEAGRFALIEYCGGCGKLYGVYRIKNKETVKRYLLEDVITLSESEYA